MARATSTAPIPEVIYYDAIAAEIVVSLTTLSASATSSRVVLIDPEKTQNRQEKYLARLPKALQQLRRESNKLATTSSNEKSEKALWIVRILLYQCFSSYVQQTGQVFAIPLLLDSSLRLRYLLEKTLTVVEEHEAVLRASTLSPVVSDNDPLMNVLRANLALHVEEAFDVQRLDAFLLPHSVVQLVPSAVLHQKDPLNVLRNVSLPSIDQEAAEEHCIALFLAYIENIASQCSIVPTSRNAAVGDTHSETVNGSFPLKETAANSAQIVPTSLDTMSVPFVGVKTNSNESSSVSRRFCLLM